MMTMVELNNCIAALHGEQMLRYWRDETLGLFSQAQRLAFQLPLIASAASGCPGPPARQLWLGRAGPAASAGWRQAVRRQAVRRQARQLRRQAGQLQRQALPQQQLWLGGAGPAASAGRRQAGRREQRRRRARPTWGRCVQSLSAGEPKC